jgi:hypothetical protein
MVSDKLKNHAHLLDRFSAEPGVLLNRETLGWPEVLERSAATPRPEGPDRSAVVASPYFDFTPVYISAKGPNGLIFSGPMVICVRYPVPGRVAIMALTTV